jgi:hypothetical protein
MARELRRPPLTGSAFIRLLAALNDAPAPASNDALGERLSRWFDWKHAISLSAALDGASTRTPDASSSASRMPNADEREVARVRATLAKMAAVSAGTPSSGTHAGRTKPPAPALGAALPAPDEFSGYRQRYVAAQQSMATAIAPVRQRLRGTLTEASPALAKLAALDALMEHVVGARERELLATVPAWLERHFDRLRHAHHEASADAPAPHAPPAPGRPGPWLDHFCQDMRGVMLAELDLRLQPVEGLLEALRRPSPSVP